MALFGLPVQRIINIHRCVCWRGHRLIQYIYRYLQILFVSCFKVKKKGLFFSWGLDLLCISSRQYVAMETNVSFRCQLISSQPLIFQTYQYFILNQERMQHYMNVCYKNPPKCHGTIVEIGALDGQLFSISKFFEDYLGWRSILVEASPYNFKKLAKNRPHSIKYNTAICRQEHIEFVGSEEVGGIDNYKSEKH